MADRSLASETRAFLEYWQLQTDPVFRGTDLPHGDGQLVLVLPGLFGNDFYLQPMREWLSRLGYEPFMSMLTVNAGCPKKLMAKVWQRLEARLGTTQESVAIVGHSRGGMLGKAIASRLGDRVSHFIALGSPVGAMLEVGHDGLAAMMGGSESGADQRGPQMASSSVMQMGQAAMRLLDPDCDSPMCKCEYWDALLTPFAATTKVTAIYSSEDPVVSPQSCPIRGANNIEVTGSHGGLVANRLVYPHIARALQS